MKLSRTLSTHRFVAAGAVVLVAAGSVGAVTVLAGGSGGGQAGEHRPQIREELLQGTEPDPECPDADEAPRSGRGEVVVNVVRVVDGCLRYSSEVVAAGQVEDRLAERRAEPDVVAADEAVERHLVGSAAPARTPAAPAPARGPRQGEAEQWALAPGHLDGEEVRSLWPADAPEVRIAVIDSGVDPRHLDLADQLAERAPWVVFPEDHDNAVDEVAEDMDAPWLSNPGMHGTHVAGTAAAADDGAGVVGLTPAARLLDVQYMNDREEDWAGPSDDIGEYIRWAVDHGADVINMSFGSEEPSDTELTAVLYADLHGVVLVASAGNCGGEGIDRIFEDCSERHQVSYPAAYEPVLSVANHDRHGARHGTSTANATVDVAAPGTNILATCPTDDDDDRPSCSSTGTSMAAPYVSATAALLRARHPDATPAAIRQAITRSAQTGSQPTDRRTDELGWGLLDPGAAAEHLDEHPGGRRQAPSPTAGRTQAAFVDAGGDSPQLFAFDDGILHPVRDVGSATVVSSVDWSADRTQLVGTDGDEVFLWNGPASGMDGESFDAVCHGCRAAIVPRSSDRELVAALGDEGSIAHFDADTLEPGDTVELQLPDAGDDARAVLRGDAGGRLVVAHGGSSGADAPDALSLVDPLTGEQVAEHAPDGNVEVGALAVDADGDRIAYADGPCGRADTVHVLAGGDLDEVSAAGMPSSADLGELQVQDLFFNGDGLYATMAAPGVGTDGPFCPAARSAGLWRLDDDGEGWRQIDTEPVAAVRPVEGMTREPRTGRLTLTGTSDALGSTTHRGSFHPTGGTGADLLHLGDELGGQLWATPTRTEVDLAAAGSTPEVPEVTTTRPSGSGGGGAPAPATVEGAIARYEQFLRALGEGDIDTLCEIAGPAARAAEEDHGIPCETGYAMVVNDLLSPEQADALRTATVDPARVETLGTGGEAPEVHIPASAVVADVTFTEDNLGDYTLAYQDGDWYIVG